MLRFQAAQRRFPALESNPYRHLLGAVAISTFGDWLYNIVLLAWIYDRTGSGTWVAAASVARILPVILFSIVAGDLADRFDRRRVMITSDIARAATMFGLVLVAILSGPPLLAVVLVFATSALGTPFLPAVDAVVPTLVSSDHLPSANAGITVVQYLALAAGPAVGGVIALLGSPSAVFAINSLTFIMSAVLIAALAPGRAEGAGERASPFRRVVEGLKVIGSSKRVLTLVACLPLTSLVPGATSVLFILFAEQSLGLEAEGATFLYAAIGVGAIVTSWFSDRLSTAGAPWAVLIVSNGVMGLAFAALGATNQLFIAYLLCAAIGAGTLVADVIAFTLLQKVLSEEFLGRVFGVVNALLYLGMAVGAVASPFIERALGLDGALVVVGTVIALLISGLCLLLRGWDVTLAEARPESDAIVHEI